MSQMRIFTWILVFALFAAQPVSADISEDMLDSVDEALRIEFADGFFQSDLSGLMDFELHYVDQRGPGLLIADDHFFNPRLSLFLDTNLGDHLYSFIQVRVDRGFDPLSNDHDMRLDEYLIRYKPFDRPYIHLQIGKFATVVGNWVNRHSSWENPFINAPLPYENITVVPDSVPPRSPEELIGYRDDPDVKAKWLPLIWGPAYTAGFSVFGMIERFDYAFEFKNAAISSRPDEWQPDRRQWKDPTLSGRLGWRPTEAWNLGLSYSSGAYLKNDAQTNGLVTDEIDDFLQYTFAQDLSFEWRKLQVWSEVFMSRFEVPNVGNVGTLAYYIEAKYKLLTRLYAALRWNQQFFTDEEDGFGNETSWDRTVYRTDAVLGYRLNRHVQAKLQYSYTHQSGPLQQGENYLGGQMTLKF